MRGEEDHLWAYPSEYMRLGVLGSNLLLVYGEAQDL